MKIFAFLFFILFSCSAFADQVNNINLEGLSEAQRAELVIKAEQMKSTTSTTKEVDEWISLGERVSKIVGITLRDTAKEVNIAVNEFATTPVGKLTVGLILWEVLGKELVHLSVGITWLVVGVGFWIHFYRRIFFIKTIKTYDGREDKLKKQVVIEPVAKHNISDITVPIFIFSLIAIVLVGFVTIFTM